MKHTAIQFKVENLGPLATGTLDLADLTVICGENNTGKTYLTYAFYGLLKMLDHFIELPEFDIPGLRQYGVAEIDLQRSVLSHAPEIVHAAMARYCKDLPRVLAAQKSHFEKTQIELTLDFEGVLTKEYKNELTSDLSRRIITFLKPENSDILTINAVNEDARIVNGLVDYRNFIGRVVKEICFAPAIPKPFIVSTERTGAVTFQSELNLAKNRMADVVGEAPENADFIYSQLRDRFYGVYGSYPLPVRDNVGFVNSLSSIQTQESQLLETHPDILNDFEDLIGGSYKMQDHSLYFIPKGTRGVRLQMSESSSAVRSLVILGYYLKHRAAPGDLLMIDEPELNLHPANQRKLARLLVRLVNAGIRIFATTHSDYIIKEFNTLIMRYARRDRAQALPTSSRYTEKDILAPDSVRVYMLREDKVRKNGNVRKSRVPTLCEADITPTFGIEVPSFDETIEDMNTIQETLYYGPEYVETA